VRRGVKLTIHLQPMPRLRKPGSIRPMPHASSWRSACLVKHKDNFCLSYSTYSNVVSYVLSFRVFLNYDTLCFRFIFFLSFLTSPSCPPLPARNEFLSLCPSLLLQLSMQLSDTSLPDIYILLLSVTLSPLSLSLSPPPSL
jgi:hypothetical protein